jgi:hypothetical protein
MRISLKALQGSAEIFGIDSPLFAEALLHLISGHNARRQLFIQKGGRIFHDLGGAFAYVLKAACAGAPATCGLLLGCASYVRFRQWIPPDA